MSFFFVNNMQNNVLQLEQPRDSCCTTFSLYFSAANVSKSLTRVLQTADKQKMLMRKLTIA